MTLPHTIKVARRVDAPREQVFQAWTEPEQLRWFFADGKGEGETVEVDLRIGGAWRLRMVESAERSYMTGGIYREIVPAARLSFSWGATDGWPPIDPDRPEDSPLVTVTFADVDGQTDMLLVTEFPAHLTQDQLSSVYGPLVKEGWSMTLYRLLISFRMPRVK